MSDDIEQVRRHAVVTVRDAVAVLSQINGSAKVWIKVGTPDGHISNAYPVREIGLMRDPVDGAVVVFRATSELLPGPRATEKADGR